jgi:hypothetical protein
MGRASLAMQYLPLSLAAAAAIALVAPADAQLREQIGSTAEAVAPLILPPSYGVYALQTVYPVCQIRREQFQDSYGWRVRDVRVCY